ncbi:MAG: pyridoxamine 5'-phosphate oxidase family protein [Acidimicrobiales bacterium]
MIDQPRPGPVRKADAIEKLETRHADAWVATASAAGKAHLVPLSFAWDGRFIVLAVAAKAATTRNVTGSGAARLALGTSRDVVMIDADLDTVVAVEDAPPSLVETYVAQSDWDPRDDTGYVFLRLLPRRVQAWREANELQGRTIMRDGRWEQ